MHTQNYDEQNNKGVNTIQSTFTYVLYEATSSFVLCFIKLHSPSVAIRPSGSPLVPLGPHQCSLIPLVPFGSPDPPLLLLGPLGPPWSLLVPFGSLDFHTSLMVSLGPPLVPPGPPKSPLVHLSAPYPLVALGPLGPPSCLLVPGCLLVPLAPLVPLGHPLVSFGQSLVILGPIWSPLAPFENLREKLKVNVIILEADT